jgi:hypothetical protein
MKIAICIGKNNYSSSPLHGCVNDANDWKEKLLSKGFDEVIMFLDSQVKKSDIRAKIRSYLELTEYDLLVITNSSHGTYTPDYTGQEINGYNEAIYWDSTYIDDEVIEDLSGLKCQWFFFNDACFSGDMTRLGFNQKMKPRFIQTCPIPKTKLVLKKFMSKSLNGVYISGCDEEQYSYDAYINGRYNGAATYYMLKSIGEIDNRSSYYSEWQQLRNYLPNQDYPQSPQLEGSTEKWNDVFLSVPIPTNIPEYPIEEPESEEPEPVNWKEKYIKWAVIALIAFGWGHFLSDKLWLRLGIPLYLKVKRLFWKITVALFTNVLIAFIIMIIF